MILLFEELDRLRRQRNWSLRELARRSGVPHQTAINVLKGGGLTQNVVRIADALGYSVKWKYRDHTGTPRLLLLAGSLATQLTVWRKKYLDVSASALAAPGLYVRTITDIDRGRPCRFDTLERYARLLGLEPTLIQGRNNYMDIREGSYAAAT